MLKKSPELVKRCLKSPTLPCVSIYNAGLPKKAFKIDLNIWNLTTVFNDFFLDWRQELNRRKSWFVDRVRAPTLHICLVIKIIKIQFLSVFLLCLQPPGTKQCWFLSYFGRIQNFTNCIIMVGAP